MARETRRSRRRQVALSSETTFRLDSASSILAPFTSKRSTGLVHEFWITQAHELVNSSGQHTNARTIKDVRIRPAGSLIRSATASPEECWLISMESAFYG
jgi:hypothetical protein